MCFTICWHPSVTFSWLHGRLRSTKTYPTVYAKTNHFENSYFVWTLSNCSIFFCYIVYIHCCHVVCLCLIQPHGCYNLVNVMLCSVLVTIVRFVFHRAACVPHALTDLGKRFSPRLHLPCYWARRQHQWKHHAESVVGRRNRKESVPSWSSQCFRLLAHSTVVIWTSG